jgi:hypothetical protein
MLQQCKLLDPRPSYAAKFMEIFEKSWQIRTFLGCLLIMTSLWTALPVLIFYLNVAQLNEILMDTQLLFDYPSLTIIMGEGSDIYYYFHLASFCIFILGKLELNLVMVGLQLRPLICAPHFCAALFKNPKNSKFENYFV